jgi:hypothetical protein
VKSEGHRTRNCHARKSKRPEGLHPGFTIDNNNVFHAFLRSSAGTLTSFDAPNAGTGQYQGTLVTLESGLNPLGALIGWYIDTKNATQGYLREPSGIVISFDPPGSAATERRKNIAKFLRNKKPTAASHLCCNERNQNIQTQEQRLRLT